MPKDARLQAEGARVTTGPLRGRNRGRSDGSTAQQGWNYGCETGKDGTMEYEPYEDGCDEPMLKWFEYRHLPPHLQVTSVIFHHAARSVVMGIESGPERTAALRKLLEAKDAAIRAVVHPGG